MGSRRSRRQFLEQGLAAGGALVASGYWTARAPATSKSPNERLNVGFIGVGGRGWANLEGVSSENVVALCDVDERNLDKAMSDYGGARRYVDFRKLLDDGNDLDAIVISTPEHTHAVAAVRAIRMGKHVYCEKPLAHSVLETRAVRDAANRHKVVTQMGTQIHATDNYRRVVELIQGGAIGAVSECHVWIGRDWGGGGRPDGEHPVPKHLHWNLWLGPAPRRPFHSDYVPGPNWYKYWDFGNGVLPDMGSHWNDLPFWALELGAPKSVEAEGPPVSTETAPPWMVVRWDFAARQGMPPVKLTWYHGGKRPALVTDGKVPAWPDGALFIGERGMLLANYQKHLLLPEEEFNGFEPPAPSIPKSIGHHAEWVQACKTGGATTCNFDYSGNLTESNLLGIVAYRVGKKLEWEPASLRAANCLEADRFIRPQLHNGWTL